MPDEHVLRSSVHNYVYKDSQDSLAHLVSTRFWVIIEDGAVAPPKGSDDEMTLVTCNLRKIDRFFILFLLKFGVEEDLEVALSRGRRDNPTGPLPAAPACNLEPCQYCQSMGEDKRQRLAQGKQDHPPVFQPPLQTPVSALGAMSMASPAPQVSLSQIG